MKGQNRFRACRRQCARWMVIFAGLWAAVCTSRVEARPRLENICTISGQQEQRLIGLGLVTGLKGTGDGGKYLPMINALAPALRAPNTPAGGPTEWKAAATVALVLIEATVPANGIRRGQRLDCFVNSIGAAKSLRGGRLMISPLGTQMVTDDRVMGI